MGFIAIQDNCTLCAFVCIQTHSFAQKKDITVQRILSLIIKTVSLDKNPNTQNIGLIATLQTQNINLLEIQ